MAHKHAAACPIPDNICAAYREQVRIIALLEDLQSSYKELDIQIAVASIASALATIKGEPGEE